MPRFLIPAFILVNAPTPDLATEAAASMCLDVNAIKPLDQRTLRLCEASATIELSWEDEDPTTLDGYVTFNPT